jgi:hypothetical protein
VAHAVYLTGYMQASGVPSAGLRPDA